MLDMLDILPFYPLYSNFVQIQHTIHDIEEITGATLTVRGVFVPPGRSLKPGERKLFMFIEAEEKSMADRARAELLRAIREVTAEIDPRSMGSSGRYSVV